MVDRLASPEVPDPLGGLAGRQVALAAAGILDLTFFALPEPLGDSFFRL